MRSGLSKATDTISEVMLVGQRCASKCLRTIVASGVDAAIVQDPGICRLIRRISPDFPIHASTQMTVTSAAGVDYARGLGASLAVLGREVSIPEMQKLQSEQAAKGAPLDLEVFVHGALCVAYSGQCLTSEALGQRSANRGECAQACRLPYQLIVDGEERDLGEQRYLMSPQDLAAWDLLPQLLVPLLVRREHQTSELRSLLNSLKACRLYLLIIKKLYLGLVSLWGIKLFKGKTVT